MILTDLLDKWIWFGFAAIGFAVLFNVPKRTLTAIFLLASGGGIVKLLTLSWDSHAIILGTFLGALTIGFLSIVAAHKKHSPPFVLAIPAIIPMVPGSFAYYTMKGVINLTNNTEPALFVSLLHDTVSNGLKTLFVLLSIVLGVSMPMLLTRRESAKQMKVKLSVKKHFQRKK